MGHRRWLLSNHEFRRQAKAFDNTIEHDQALKSLNGDKILQLVESIEHEWGKSKTKKRKRIDNDERVWWKKKSIFYNLDYWKYLLVRHQLDVMRIEKNVCESIYGTLLHILGKTKDGLKSRKDLVSIKVPYGYSSNIKNLVSMKDFKLQGLKSHDCHVLMQQLLLIALRCVLSKHVKDAIIRFCFFFNSLCATVVDVSVLDKLETDIVVTLCLLKKCFPPSFFDIMVHLTVHLVNKVRLCGPVYLRWMYPFERYTKTLKGYVRNRNCPEGCIAERYIAEEAVEFYVEYMSNMYTVGLSAGHVQKLSIDKQLSDTLRWILQDPLPFVDKQPSYDINGFHFVTHDLESNRVTQNSGVTLVAKAMHVATSKDKNPITCDTTFYGVIDEIWVVDYHLLKIPVLKCDWVQNRGGVLKDEHGSILVDLNRRV
ncbi:uncharacterized protein LOC119996072 [Tripterygium wilfordii]|uniref:uncharacterized protein LOC119996072 n=1 Tax=Tripterygium wilfordii TaxID=458696 RepID=UPI0018F853C8|nr:uncharacterized protein LOC119996072 [Tripterygium wilfordii]